MWTEEGWHLVLPIKGGSRAKSRLQVEPPVRVQLAHALAQDCLAAVTQAELASVVVVTSDPWMSAAAAASGVGVVPDPGRGPNAAARAGLGVAPARLARAVLLADLPALTVDALLVGLRAAAAHDRAFVPDRQGLGTVLLTARARMPLRPTFGPASAAAHAADGVTRLELDLPRLRTDVDTAEDLAVAVALGVGVHTAALLPQLAPALTTTWSPAPPSAPNPAEGYAAQPSAGHAS